MIVLVVSATPLVPEALAAAGGDGEVVVVSESAAELAAVEERVRDPRLWYLIGSAEVLPLPDASVDLALGDGGPDVARVLR